MGGTRRPDRQAVGLPGRGHEHPRVQIEEDRECHERDREGRRGEGEAVLGAPHEERHRDRQAEGRQRNHAGNEPLVMGRLSVQIGPEEKDEHKGCGHDREPPGRSARTLQHLVLRLEREIDGAVQREDREGHEAPEERVRVEQRQQRAGVLPVRVDRHALQHVRERHTPEQRRKSGAEEDRAIPPRPPARRITLAAVLEGDTAHDERDEDQEQREVEPREQRGVPAGEGSEGRAAGREEPHLVAVPDRPDRVDHHPPVGVVLGQKRQQRSDAEIESLEHEVADPEDGDQREPQDFQVPVAGWHRRRLSTPWRSRGRARTTPGRADRRVRAARCARSGT